MARCHGVIIGIASILATAAVIQGLNTYVSDKLSNLGKGVFTVQRFALITNRQEFLDAVRRNRKLETEDAHAIIERCTSVRAVGWETHATADLKHAAEHLMWGKFVNAGQTCVAPDHLYVHHSVRERFVQLCQQVLAQRFGAEHIITWPKDGRLRERQ